MGRFLRRPGQGIRRQQSNPGNIGQIARSLSRSCNFLGIDDGTGLQTGQLSCMFKSMQFDANNQRLSAAFRNGNKALIAYFPVGNPDISPALLHTYGDCGCDIVELGLKASNPYLDGTSIRNAMLCSNGPGKLCDATAALKAIRNASSTMAALIFCYASRNLLDSSRKDDWARIDALLCAPEQETDNQQHIHENAGRAGVKITEFVPYHFDKTDLERAKNASGYVMLQYAQGKTGLRDGLDAEAEKRLSVLRNAGVRQPIVLGIGLSTSDQCRHAIDVGADGAVVGTQALLKCLDGQAAIAGYLSDIRRAIGV